VNTNQGDRQDPTAPSHELPSMWAVLVQLLLVASLCNKN